jgi:uncharacterized LabA/DUF88 family protein
MRRISTSHMNVTDSRLKIAVFIDFDNVEIGVKTTIGGQFDIGLILEAIKERGEIVTKIAYSDWKRAGDYSRLLTQHAIRMVQRNLTPGGDKNGADITMALDALEMAFTHDHINAFVIVGGDSDFISLVEKLKQYDRKVIVVGGRLFTSATMQKNCHEFIAYENLVGGTRSRNVDRGDRPAVTTKVSQALPLVKRALKVLSDREVTPQLGLLKSTLLQLDSTFSERDYGASSFRDFMEKVAEAGAVTLKHAGRSMLVETRDDSVPESFAEQASAPAAPSVSPENEEPQSPAVPSMSMADGIRLVQQALARGNPRWPMYVRQVKQFLKAAIDGFDERRYGFATLVDLLRGCAKEGVVRIERDRQGVMRIFQGTNLRQVTAPVIESDVTLTDVPADVVAETGPVATEQIGGEPPIIDAQPIEVPSVAEPAETRPAEEVPQKRVRRGKNTGAVKRTAAAGKAATGRPRTRKRSKAKAEAADVS